ncbi:MAG TPA: hypothetical protein VHQ21_02560 [Rhodanobacteraceae bacterium]|jgi:hypothetical protein|nr:hypothetical protein [Rhodanobacteraceae bacterium]
MQRYPMIVSLAYTALLFSSAAYSQSPSPADEAECNSIAIQQSGYDPAKPPPAPTAQAAPVTGSGTRARGAVAGAAVGAIGGNDVGNAAAKGAVVGGVAQRNRNRGAAAQANASAAQQQQSGAAAYQSARAACLQAKGYK